MSQDNKNLWDQIWSGLMSKFGKNFQLQVPFSSYYWGNPQPGYINYRTYDLFNQRPTWSAVGKRETGGTGIYEAYGTVIQFAPKFVATPAKQQALADIESDINRAQSNLVQDNKASYTGFALAQKAAHAEGKTLDYSTWMVDKGWEKIIQEDRAKIDALQVKKAELIAEQYPDNKKYIEAYTPPDPTAKTTDKAFLKCFISTAEFWRAIYEAPTPHEIINKMSGGGPKLTIKLDSTKPSHAIDKSWAHSQIDDSFFSIYVDRTWKKLDLTESGGKVTATISLDKIDNYAIKIGGWYSGTYLAHLKKQDSWASNYSADKVFGNDGLLPLISTDFIAFMGMTISVEVSKSAFEKYHEVFTTSAGVRIGPFSFGGDSGTSSDKFKKSAENSTFTVTLTNEYPFITGYLVARADGGSL